MIEKITVCIGRLHPRSLHDATNLRIDDAAFAVDGGENCPAFQQDAQRGMVVRIIIGYGSDARPFQSSIATGSGAPITMRVKRSLRFIKTRAIRSSAFRR